MKSKIHFLVTFIGLFLSIPVISQIQNPVTWRFESKMTSNNEALLTFTASMDKGWHIYALHLDGNGPIPTSIKINPNDGFSLIGNIVEVTKPIVAFDKTFNMNIGYYEHQATFTQKVKLNQDKASIEGNVEYMVCNDMECLPPTEEPFTFQLEQIKTEKPSAPISQPEKQLETQKTVSIVTKDSTTKASTQPTIAEPQTAKEDIKPINTATSNKSIWSIFIEGFLGGLAAFLMPCIFPMLPFTVSYFTKTTSSKGSAIGKALFYGLSIIIIYVILGLAVTIAFGSDALNNMASNGVFNMLFFILLLIFSFSFLGAFEITLPSSWINKSEAYADKGGVLGIFFMATSLALVSFSCTGPIIGTLLVQAASKGAILGPVIGMLGFAIALALPFALFAMFPSWMNQLPKSGGWLNSIKVVLGFLELALAMKFLSNVDLAYHWNLFDREVFLVLWISIFGLMGLYLLGKLKLAHDSDIKSLSVTRLMLAIVTFSFTVYLIPGLWGAPLKAVSAFLPPAQTQDFDLFTPTLLQGQKTESTSKKYDNKFHAPYQLNAYFDYDEALAYAAKVNKPLMIDFTGHTCVNCRKMEADVWSDKAVLDVIRNKYVLVQLYVDDKTELAPQEQFQSSFSGKTIKTIGAKWSDFQASRFHSNSQPFYVLLDTTGELLVQPQGADYNATRFYQYLQNGLNAFENQ
jgi:thiol:disulfide interchange protein DsbD